MQGYWWPVRPAYDDGMSSFLDYLDEISGGETQAGIAAAAGVQQSSVSRWRRGSAPSPDAVAKLATHYGRPFPEMLTRAGLITEESAQALRIATGTNLSAYRNAALLRELERRLEARASDPAESIQSEEHPNPDDYDLAAGTVARPDDRPAD